MSSHKHRHHHEDKRIRAIKIILSILLVICLILFLIYAKSTILNDNNDSATEQKKKLDSILIGDTRYALKDVDTLLLIGIDIEGEQVSSDSYNNAEQCDVIDLMVFNNEDNTYRILEFNRDMIAEVPVLSLYGEVADYKQEQIAFAHTYGSGMEDSCENVVSTIESILYGINISNYICTTMSSIPDVVDALGNVQVTLDESYTELDSSYKSGATITLTKDNSMAFVRSRSGMNEDTNVARMHRQELFIDSCMETYQNNPLSESKILDTYDLIEDYLVTSGSNAQTMISKLPDYTFEGIVSFEGENTVGEEYMEFYVDEDSLEQTVITLFTNPYEE